MNNKLEDFFTEITAEELEELDCPIPETKISKSAKKRILSSALRKDDSKMKKIKFKKSITIIAAAAILATATVSAGAAAYNYFINRESVKTYLGNSAADQLESLGVVENRISENDHLKMTIDTTISDGYIMYNIVTFEGKDDMGKEFIKTSKEENFGLNAVMFDLPVALSCQPTSDENKLCYQITMVIDNLDITGDIFKFGVMKNENDKIFENLKPIELSVKKNVDTIKLYSEDGKDVMCSPIGITFVGEAAKEVNDVYYIKNDGSKEKCEKVEYYSGWGDETPTFIFVMFGEVLDLNNYSGFEVDGIMLDLDNYSGCEVDSIKYMKE